MPQTVTNALAASPSEDTLSERLLSGALDYHRYPRPGKLQIQPTKPLVGLDDLSFAYSPGVAAACMAIHADESEAVQLTGRSNLVAVISNGSAVLGLGDIGPLASKPVMEGKAVLFKRFADIDAFDLEISSRSVEEIVTVIAALEPTFGGINLEDIKAPECFEIERRLRDRMGIPVFHDDQHGTAIIVSAAVLNALRRAGKTIAQARIVTSGAGAAALACLDLLIALGARRENITVTDLMGVVHSGRTGLMDPWKRAHARDTDLRTLAEAIDGADIFLGLSAAGVLKADMVARMARDPLIMALANPIPEIMPGLVQQVRGDAMICTGRSDFPNQVNNVLCFPHIFRGALDCGATEITKGMELAAVHALAALASEGVETAHTPLIPSPFDPRLAIGIAPAVAGAAAASGVATRPIADLAAYAEALARRLRDAVPLAS
ncbi:hypothetical protein CAF53_22325 [Sphingobium sp. LB126]|nr:hypothetical protein CAF53_22325 [Sphingobium sp. LB126]